MNKVVLIGRVTKDPELKYLTTGTAVASFTVAVDRIKKGEADFINCKAFGKTAESIATYSAKGKMIAVNGRIQTSSFEAKDGSKRYTTDVVANGVQFIEWADKKSPEERFTDLQPVDEDPFF